MCRWPPGVGDNDLLATTLKDSRYGGGPGLALSRLHDDRYTDELRGQRGGIAEVDGAPVPVVQTVGPPAWERSIQGRRGRRHRARRRRWGKWNWRVPVRA